MARLLLLSLSILLISGFGNAPQDEDRKAAYVEEITVMPDGSQQVQRYPYGQEPVYIPVEQPTTPPPPRQRGLTRVEKLELDRLENDFEFGRITATEYYLRRNQILRSTYVDAPPDDNILEQQWRY